MRSHVTAAFRRLLLDLPEPVRHRAHQSYLLWKESDWLFVVKQGAPPKKRFERCSARELGLSESWFRDAIFKEPKLVIEACQAAGVTDDEWYAWAKEYQVDVGSRQRRRRKPSTT